MAGHARTHAHNAMRTRAPTEHCMHAHAQAIFRGFLLTSMTRYMPVPWAAAGSSLMFAMCHFRQQVGGCVGRCHEPGEGRGSVSCESHGRRCPPAPPRRRSCPCSSWARCSRLSSSRRATWCRPSSCTACGTCTCWPCSCKARRTDERRAGVVCSCCCDAPACTHAAAWLNDSMPAALGDLRTRTFEAGHLPAAMQLRNVFLGWRYFH